MALDSTWTWCRAVASAEVIPSYDQVCLIVLVAGWIRANDRTMILKITFQDLPSEQQRKWLALLEGTSSEAAEIEVRLKYDNGDDVWVKSRGPYPERVRAVRFDSSVKNNSDVVVLSNDNALNLVISNGDFLLRQGSSVADVNGFFQVSCNDGEVCLQFKLSTNITSKSHENRRFQYTCHARCGPTLESLATAAISRGESYDFEFAAKHRGETKAAQSKPKAAPKQATVARPIKPQQQILLSSASYEVQEGERVIRCIGENVTASGVRAELTHVDSLGSGKKRKLTETFTQNLKPDAALTTHGNFVARLPLDLPAGSYQVRLRA